MQCLENISCWAQPVCCYTGNSRNLKDYRMTDSGHRVLCFTLWADRKQDVTFIRTRLQIDACILGICLYEHTDPDKFRFLYSQ